MYSIPLIVQAKGVIDTTALKHSVHMLGDLYPTLRTRFSRDAFGPYQYIHQSPLTIQIHRFDSEAARQRAIAWDLQKPFRPRCLPIRFQNYY